MKDSIRPFYALYTSRCEICEQHIVPDEEVVYMDEEVVHVQCAEDEGWVAGHFFGGPAYDG